MRRFFEQAGDARSPAEDPATLLKWLFEVARNRLREQHRRQRARMRGGGALREVDPGARDRMPGGGPDHSEIAADREVLDRLMGRMSPDRRDIARDHGANAEAFRKRDRRVSTPSSSGSIRTTPERRRSRNNR